MMRPTTTPSASTSKSSSFHSPDGREALARLRIKLDSTIRFRGKTEEHPENCFRGMDIRAARCLNAGRDIIMETNHEEAQYPWDCRWSGVIDCGARLASMVARKECGGIP